MWCLVFLVVLLVVWGGLFGLVFLLLFWVWFALCGFRARWWLSSFVVFCFGLLGCFCGVCFLVGFFSFLDWMVLACSGVVGCWWVMGVVLLYCSAGLFVV